MILKLVRNTLVRTPARLLVASQPYLFSDEKPGKGFSNFIRKKNSNQDGKDKVDNKDPEPKQQAQMKEEHKEEEKINEDISKSTSTSEEAAQNVTLGFQKFSRRKQRTANMAPKPDEQKTQAAGEPKTAEKEESKPSRNLHKRQKKPPIKIIKPVEKPKQAQQSKINMASEPEETPEQKQKRLQQQQLDRKQRLFEKKIGEARQKLQSEQIKSRMPSSLKAVMDFFNNIDDKIYKATGINFSKQPDPPKWIKGNSMLEYLYQMLFQKWLLVALLCYGLLDLVLEQINKLEQITPSQFMHWLESGKTFEVKFVEIFFSSNSEHLAAKKKSMNVAIVHLGNRTKYRCPSNPDFQNKIRSKVNELNQQEAFPKIIITNMKQYDSDNTSTFRNILSMALLYFFINSIREAGLRGKGKGGGRPGPGILGGKQKSKRFEQPINVHFRDVVGMQKAKEEVVEFIDFLKNPEKYHRLGAKIPRGALLTGPPGTGKTMIAKACAGESKVPFFTISGSEFIEMFVGVGAQRVRDLFKQAKQAAPSIIFIDEIDAVGKKRASGFGGGNDERDNTLNQLLVEMDGFDSKADVIVFAATNQKQVLDPALTRPGRFDRLIQVDLPDLEGRKQIFMVHLKPIVLDEKSSIEQYAKRMATLTPGFSGADIKNLCNEAAIMAARNNHEFVTLQDFELATERIIGGVEKKSHLITPETQRVVAYHECGHGVVSWFLPNANPLLKLTIIPRSKGALGFAQYLPHETQISTKQHLLDQICVILAGRVTEEIFFKKVSTGAYDDLQKAYSVAKTIVTKYGMSEKLGWLSYEQSEYAKDYSEDTQKRIDSQILAIIKQCTERTRQLVAQKKQLIESLATRLQEQETVDLTVIREVLGQRPYRTNKQYEEYLNEHKKMQAQSTVVKLLPPKKRSDYIV